MDNTKVTYNQPDSELPMYYAKTHDVLQTNQDLPVYNGPRENMMVYAAAQRVRPLDGLGNVPDEVDCPKCRKVVTTRITRIKSERSRLYNVVCCVVFTPCWCAWWIPDMGKLGYDYQHECPSCDKILFIFRHNSQQNNPGFVPSEFGVQVQQPAQH